MHVRKKESESSTALINRFTKKVKQGGVLREARKRRFHTRPESRIKKRLSALHRAKKKAAYEKAKKMGSV